MAYYYTGESGDDVSEKVFHSDEGCDELDEPVRPIVETTAESLGGDIHDCGGADEAPGTCEVEKGDGEICGRDLPCPYHSD